MFATLLIIDIFVGGYSCPTRNTNVVNIGNAFSNITASIYEYQDKYRALPGDINRDGKIDGAFDSTKNNDESRLFWLHLRKAGLFDGDPNDQQQPTSKFGLIGVSSCIDTCIGKEELVSRLYIGFSGIPGNIAIMFESRVDDGKANSGSIQSHRTVSDMVIPVEVYAENGIYNLYFSL
jgi:hypothetical protein